MSDLFGTIFPDLNNKKDFAEFVWNSMCQDDDICRKCAAKDLCDHAYFITDENGEYIKTEDGDYIENDDYPGCDKIILQYLESKGV